MTKVLDVKVYNLNEVKDALAELTFGMSFTEAMKKQVCIDCKKPISEVMRPDATELEKDEYARSGICPICFNKIEDLMQEDMPRA